MCRGGGGGGDFPRLKLCVCKRVQSLNQCRESVCERGGGEEL